MSFLVKNYNRKKISFKYGKGSFLYSTDGKKYLDSLQIAGVEHIGFSKESSDLPTGKCLIFVTPDAKRTMSSMLGISAYLGPADIDYDVIENSRIFYIEFFKFSIN